MSKTKKKSPSLDFFPVFSFFLVAVLGLSFLLREESKSVLFNIMVKEAILASENQATQNKEEKTEEIENVAEEPPLETIDWLVYKSPWYGFEIKYPQYFNKPILKGASRGAKWEYRYQFRRKKTEESNPFLGLDVVVYNIKKVSELSGTDEFPVLKNKELPIEEDCRIISGHLAENKNYPAEQIYIGKDDNCYEPAYFYTLTRDDYIYNLVPILAEKEITFYSEAEMVEIFPEFISATTTFNLIEINRPKNVVVKPKITAPKPLTYKIDEAGRLVCAKKKINLQKARKLTKNT